MMIREEVRRDHSVRRHLLSMLSMLSMLLVLLEVPLRAQEPAGDLIIFHAGSLSVPVQKIGEAFRKKHPQVRILCEAAGSRACARKITDLGKPCDIMASADDAVIDTLLIPKHAAWNLVFATNELGLAYHPESRGAAEIASGNWQEILLRPDIAFGRSDPDADPCGYRTVLLLRLAETFSGNPGLAEKFLAKDQRFIRPKETDLLALLEGQAIDYLFIYRSVAVQHGLEFLALPAAINLADPAMAAAYASATVEVTGAEPGTAITMRGEPIRYGITIPNGAPNPVAARAFLRFLVAADGGLAILEACGQKALVPAPTATFDALPEDLKPFARPPGGF